MKIMIPLDGSEFAEEALERATRIVNMKTGEIEVYFVKKGAKLWRS